ncbi:MAG: YdjY domain-containing protein [Tepidisphaeraceae bacterium]
MNTRTAAILAVALAGVSPAVAQFRIPEATQKLDDRTAAARKAAEGNADQKVWNGVIADRRAKTVTIFAVATNIQPTDPVEFFVAPISSGKDYESLTVTTAMPSDVKAALEFIGLTPGLGVDFNADRYWPRGPRVVMNLVIDGKAVRAESLVQDTRTNRTLPPTGLIFTGSFTRNDADGKPLLAADVHESRPISPIYSEPAAVLDLPRQTRQSEIYGSQRPSPNFTAKPNDAVDVVLSPATGADAVAEKSAVIATTVVQGATRFSLSINDAAATTSPATTAASDAALDLPKLVVTFAREVDGTADVFTRVSIASDTPVKDVRNLFAVLQAVEKDRGLKLEPPTADQLFFRAYFPDEAWKDRATRLGEPWELFLSRDAAGKLVGKLERQVENDDGKKVVQTTQPADPAAMAAHVDANPSQWSRTLFIYPPADLTQGELMTWALPAKKTLPRIFVFPADAK